MGNKIDAPKIKNHIFKLGEKACKINELAIFKINLTEFIELIGFDFKNNSEIEKTLIEILSTFEENSVLNIINNLIFEIRSSKDNVKNILFCLDFIKIIIGAINKKNKHFREILIFSLDNISKNKNDVIKDNIFPLNLLKLSIDLICDEEFERSILNNFY